MKVTATGVDDETVRDMFLLWLKGIDKTQVEAEEIDVRFVLGDENART